MAGNKRFADGVPVNQGRDTLRRAEVAQGQSPFATILSCADSRVTPEVIFDVGIGDLFVVRVAGNTATGPVVQGSLEFSVENLNTVLLMVLGHQSCGAVSAALREREPHPGQIPSVIEPILPIARSVEHLAPHRRLDAAVEANIRAQTQLLADLAPIIGPAVSAGRLMVVGAEYLLDSGTVNLLT